MDLSLYYDQETFKAFDAVSPRPHFDAPPALDRALIANSAEVWELLQDPKTHVYVAGLAEAAQKFEEAVIAVCGSAKIWSALREQLVAAGRFHELLYA